MKTIDQRIIPALLFLYLLEASLDAEKLSRHFMTIKERGCQVRIKLQFIVKLTDSDKAVHVLHSNSSLCIF